MAQNVFHTKVYSTSSENILTVYKTITHIGILYASGTEKLINSQILLRTEWLLFGFTKIQCDETMQFKTHYFCCCFSSTMLQQHESSTNKYKVV